MAFSYLCSFMYEFNVDTICFICSGNLSQILLQVLCEKRKIFGFLDSIIFSIHSDVFPLPGSTFYQFPFEFYYLILQFHYYHMFFEKLKLIYGVL